MANEVLFAGQVVVTILMLLAMRGRSLPPPMDLHVTPQLYATMKKSWKAEVGMSIAGVDVIPDLPIYSPHQYEWRSRPPLPKGPPHADRPER